MSVSDRGISRYCSLDRTVRLEREDYQGSLWEEALAVNARTGDGESDSPIVVSSDEGSICNSPISIRSNRKDRCAAGCVALLINSAS